MASQLRVPWQYMCDREGDGPGLRSLLSESRFRRQGLRVASAELFLVRQKLNIPMGTSDMLSRAWSVEAVVIIGVDKLTIDGTRRLVGLTLAGWHGPYLGIVRTSMLALNRLEKSCNFSNFGKSIVESKESTENSHAGSPDSRCTVGNLEQW